MKKILSPMLALSLVLQLFVFALSPLTADAATTIFSDSFEDSGLAGWTKHESGTVSQSPSVSGEDSASPDTGRFAKIAEDTNDGGSEDGWICREISAFGYNDLELSYHWRGDADSTDSSDDGLVQYKAGTGSCAGTSGWSELKNHDIRTDSTWTTQLAFDLPDALDNTVFRLRFYNDSSTSNNNEYFRVDGVNLTGEPIPGTLVVQKVVVNDNGGTNTAANFSFQINGGTAIEFEADGQNNISSVPGSYNVTEVSAPGYTTTYDGCSNIILASGQTNTCTITNNDITPSLTLIKQVEGNDSPSLWVLTASGLTGFSGPGPSVSSDADFDAGTYTLSESAGPTNYTASDWSCAPVQNNGNEITLGLGQNTTCTITNTYEAPHEEPQEPPQNSCLIPETEDGDTVALGTSPETPLQQILNGAGYSIDANVDQIDADTWNSSGNTVHIEATFLAGFANNPSVFGYYTDGSPSSFVPLFRKGSHPDFPLVPLVSPEYATTTSVSGVSSVNFAINTWDGSSAHFYSTDPTDNDTDGSNDHAAIYNPLTDEFVVAFEDKPFESGDEDYNDMVVKIKTACENPLICNPQLDLIANGGFETPQVTHGDKWDVFDDGFAGLGWGVAWVNPSGAPVPASLELHRGVNGWLSSVGEQHAELDGDWTGPDGSNGEAASTKIWQNITTIPGKNYKLTFDFSGRPGTDTTQNKLGVLWDGAPVTGSPFILANAGSQTDWQDYEIILPAAVGSLTELAFRDEGAPDSLGTFLDNVALYCTEEEPCNPTSGSIVSDENTIVSVVEIEDVNPNATPNTPAIPVSVVVAIQALGSGVWGADVDDAAAKWIWSEDSYDANWQVDKWVTFTRAFNIVGTPEGATLKIASDNSYEVFVNDNPVGSDTSENNHSSADTIVIPAGSLLNGSNTLKIVVKNWELPNGPKENNPGGLLFNLAWIAKDCGDNENPNELEEYQVHVQKYLNGQPVSENVSASFDINYTFSGSAGSLELNQDNDFTWFDPLIHITEGGSADVAEDTTGNVLPYGEQCVPGKYRLVKYTYGDTWPQAEESLVSTTDSFHVSGINKDKYVIIWNETCPTEATIVATKITCTNEADLPNWGEGDGTSPINAQTAIDWVNSHPSCDFEEDWQFQWAPSTASNPGNNNLVAAGSPWNTSGLTDTNGVVQILVPVPTEGAPYIWFREVLKTGYLAFSEWLSDGENTPNTDDENSAEIYCNTDVLNYDNFDRVDDLVAGNTYYCVAWNVPNGGPSQYSLTLVLFGDGNGSVLGDGITCEKNEAGEVECEYQFDENTEIDLTAIPDEDSNFDSSWSESCTGNDPLCSIVMDGNKLVKAHFDKDGTLVIDDVTDSGDSGSGGGGGGGGRRHDISSLVAGSSSSGSTGEVLGATTDLPGLPNTGNGENMLSVAQIVLLALLFLGVLNITASKTLKLNK